MNENKSRFWIPVLLGVLGIGIAASLNGLFLHSGAQIDLTQDKRFTVSPALERIAGTLTETCRVTCYISESLPRYIQHVPRSLRTVLDAVRRASSDHLEYEFVDPKDDIDLGQKLKQKKIEPLPLQDIKDDQITQGSYYLTVVFRYGDQEEVLNLVDMGYDLAKEEKTLSALPAFVASRLVKVSQPEAVVGIASDKKMVPQQGQQQPEATDGMEQLRTRLKSHCKVKDVTLKNGIAVPDDIKCLIVHKPEKLAPADVYQLDQFMMRGGRVVLLLENASALDLDRLQAIGTQMQQDNYSLRAIDSGLNDWLAHYGIVVSPGLVMDRKNHKLARIRQVTDPRTGMPTMQIKQEVNDLPGVLDVRQLDEKREETGQMEASETTVAGIGALAFMLPTPMQLDVEGFAKRHSAATLPKPQARIESLVRSSKEAWVVKDFKDTLSMVNSTPPPREEWGSWVLVARASGMLKSFFAGKDVPAGVAGMQDQAESRSTRTESNPKDGSQLWVIADSDFASDVWVNSFGRMGAMGLAKGLQISSAMLTNVVDVASGGSDLVEMRRARLIDRSINETQVKEDRTKITFLNLFMMPIALIAFGLVWWMVRAAQTFVASPRQPVTVASNSQPPAPAPEPAGAGAHGAEGH